MKKYTILIIIVSLLFQKVYSQKEGYTQSFSMVLGNKIFLVDSNHNYIDTFGIERNLLAVPFGGQGYKLDENTIYYCANSNLYRLKDNKIFKNLLIIGNELIQIDSIVYLSNRRDSLHRIINLSSKDEYVSTSGGCFYHYIRHCNGRDWILLGTIRKTVIEDNNYPIVSIFDGNQLIKNEYGVNYPYHDQGPIQFDFPPSGEKILIHHRNPSGDKIYIACFDRKFGNIYGVEDITSLASYLTLNLGERHHQYFFFYNENELINFFHTVHDKNKKVKFYKLDFINHKLDSIEVPLENFVDSLLLESLGITNQCNIQHVGGFSINRNTFHSNLKSIFSHKTYFFCDTSNTTTSNTTLHQLFSLDLSDFFNPKFKRLYKAGLPIGYNYSGEDYILLDSLNFGFIASLQIFGNLPSTPEAGFSYQIQSSCQRNEYKLELTDTSCCHFYRIWDYGDGTVSDTLWVTQHWELSGKIDSFRTVSHTYSQPGRYKVKLKILNPYNYGEHLPPGEFVMDSTEKWIEIPPCIEPGIGLRDTICVFDTLEVMYTGSENVDSLKLKVKPSGNVVKSIEKQSTGKVTFEEPGIYHIELEAKNAYYDTTWVYPDDIVVLDCDELWIPNAFTPNNDGINDVFSYVCRNCVWNSLEIFNRDTQPIFRCEGSEACIWLGKTDKGAVPEGVYVYRLKVRKRDGREVERVGTVTVMR